MDVLGNKNLFRIRELLHARCNVDRLAEIIEPFVQCYRNRRAFMDPDLENDGAVSLLAVESIDLIPHRKSRSDRVGRFQERGHDGIADGLDDRAMVAGYDVLQQIEMPLDQGEGIEVADAVIECG